MPKLLMLDKEDNVMVYVCSYSHRSYYWKYAQEAIIKLLFILPYIMIMFIIHARIVLTGSLVHV